MPRARRPAGSLFDRLLSSGIGLVAPLALFLAQFTASPSAAQPISVTGTATLHLFDDLSLSGNLVLDHGGALTRSAETIAVGGLFISDNASLAGVAPASRLARDPKRC